jgi:hypothetical protein
MRTPYQERLLVELWNRHYQPGTAVLVRGAEGETPGVTTGHAYLLDQRQGRVRLDMGDVELGQVRPVRTQFATVSAVVLELDERSPEDL